MPPPIRIGSTDTTKRTTRQLSSRTGRSVTLPPVHPNAGIRAAYRRSLTALAREMADDIERAVLSAYAEHPPEVAQDSAADVFRELFRRLAARWLKRFNEMAPKLAAHFAIATKDRVDGSLGTILKDAGWTVDLKLSAPVRDVLKATTAENMALIKSIASQHLTEVETLVMRSATVGGQLSELKKALATRYGITERRASLIARDQSSKATAAITKARQQEVGITEAIWMHSSAGKTPRPTHVANDGKKYTIADGWYDPAVKKRIWPGTEINCRCISRSILPAV